MTIEKLKSGNYRARVFIGTIDGKKKYKNFTGNDKKKLVKDASDYEYTLKFNRASGSDSTLNEAIDSYISMRSNILSPSTIAGYLKVKKNHFNELLPLMLSKLTNSQIQSSVNKMSTKLSPKTIRNAFGLLSATLKTFLPELRLLIRLPKSQHKPIAIPSSETIEKLLSNCKNSDLQIAILLSSMGSLRRSEICALTATDVFDTFIRIDKANVYDKNYNQITKSTKNYDYRDVPLPPFVIEKIKKIEGRIVKLSPSTLSNQYIKLKKECDVTTSFHKLRHYYASSLHALGVPDQYICARGGWSSPKTLQEIYQHPLTENDKKVDEITANFFNQKFNS